MLHCLRDLQDERLGCTHRLVLYAMLAYREGEAERVYPELRGACAPSVAQLVRSTGLSERAVRYALADLRAWGHIAIRRPGTPRTATIYEVLPEVQSLHPEGAPEGPLEGSRPAPDAPRTCTGRTPEVQTEHPTGAPIAPSADHLGSVADQSADQHPSTKPSTGSLFWDESGDDEKPSRKIASAAVARVWEHYVTCWRRVVGQGAEPKLTPKRRAQIASRLRDGYSAEQITRAIDGLFASDFHRGANDRGTRYLEIEQVTRAGERIEKFGTAKTTPSTTRGTKMIRQAPAPDELAGWRVTF